MKQKMRGIALVEVTIVLPFLFLLMFACIEVGRLLYSYNTLTKLTRDSARFLSDRAFEGSLQIIDLNPEKIIEVNNFVVYGNMQGSGSPRLENLAPSQITVSSDGPYVIVEVNYPFTTIFGNTLSTLSYGNDIDIGTNLHTQVSMRAIN